MYLLRDLHSEDICSNAKWEQRIFGRGFFGHVLKMPPTGLGDRQRSARGWTKAVLGDGQRQC